MATKAGRYDEVLLGTRGTAGSVYALNADTVSVEVLESDGATRATLYTDRGKSGTASNPVLPDAAGNIEFFADPGIYVLKVSNDGTLLRTDTVNVSVDGVEAGGFTSASSDETVSGAWTFSTDPTLADGSSALSLTEGNAAYLRTYDVVNYGAVGDGTTDDRTAIQAAVTAAEAAADQGIVFFPAGYDFAVSAPVTVSESVALVGGNHEGTIVRALTGFSGAIFEWASGAAPTALNMTLVGTAADGCDAFGPSGTGGSYGSGTFERLKVYGFDYGWHFDQASEFPLRWSFRDVYVYNTRTCGIELATGGHPDSGQAQTPGSGQSAVAFDNVVITNGGGASNHSISASSVSVTNDSPTTSADTITWSSTGAVEFGWVIMRRPSGSTDVDAWQHVAYVTNATTSYEASKTAGDYYDYVVLRSSRGVYLRYLKAVDIGALQTEYVALGLEVREGRAVNVSAFYDEWHGQVSASPTPRGNGMRFANCRSVHIATMWADKLHSGVQITGSSYTRVATGQFQDCARSAVHLEATDAGMPVDLGALRLAGTTPAVVSTSGSAFDANYLATNRNVTDATLERTLHIGHTTKAEFAADYRSTRKSAFGADTDGGYQWLNDGTLPTAAAAYDGQIRRDGGRTYVCHDDGGGYQWHAIGQLADLAAYQHIFPGSEKSNVNWSNVSLDTGRWFTLQSLSSGAQNDEKVWDIDLAAGTWTLTLWHLTAGSRGIYHFLLDGVEVATIDGYSSSAAVARTQVTGITVAESGRKTLTVRMASKNASSSGYYGDLSGLSLTRTA